jgi:hypothetical protein
MPSRPQSRCLTCKRLHPGTGRCPTCFARARAEQDARRPTARERGYDAQHDREAIAAKAAAVEVRALCPRCGQPVLAGQELDYGHTTARAHDPASRADRVEHAHCNRVAQHHAG